MEELYWITRLDSLITFSEIVLGFSSVFLFISILCCIVLYFKDDDEVDVDLKKVYKRFKKATIISFIITIIFLLSKTFIPTTEEALIIVGAGTTYEYVKDNNDKFKKLPDKAIKALDIYFDKILEENK